MADHGGGGDSGEPARRSRPADYADLARAAGGDERPMRDAGSAPLPSPEAASTPRSALESSPDAESDEVTRGRREFAALLGEFRRTAVLVPLDEDEAPLVGDYGGVRWIYAFSDETALARFALARGEGSREWPYRRVLGARLLDAAVPAAGVPCGVALDVGSGGDGALFPPVTGIVPDGAAVGTQEEKGVRPR
ncbi:hypothetical protein ACH4UM_02590 [Streptomyces sp. NPDC020801]|uniref:hypothetical protein n=1 Tax=unclassified Streptomyces TaxID=2593676 RepID=UPI0037B6CA31